jgi:hypothetical protein
MHDRVKAKRRSVRDRGWSVLLAVALGSCGSIPRTPVERILQEGDCASVPDIERLSFTVSDHGAKVSFQWSGTRFGGTVQTSMDALARDASYGVNRAGEWEKRFPAISSSTTISGAYLGFPAASNAGAGVAVATVYETQYPAPNAAHRGVAVVDLKTSDTVMLAAPRRVGSIVVSPKGDYVAIVEIASSTTMGSWRDLLGLQRNAESPRFDVYATVYSTSGLVACTRELATKLPSPIVNAAWRS